MITNRTAVVEMPVALLVMAGTVQAATVIHTCPFVIASPGDYVLSANLSCFGGGTGITTTPSHVTLKLEGHTIVPGGNGGRDIEPPIFSIVVLSSTVALCKALFNSAPHCGKIVTRKQ